MKPTPESKRAKQRACNTQEISFFSPGKEKNKDHDDFSGKKNHERKEEQYSSD